jgi:RNA polymerase sigma-70 factor (ECF subfamily)
VTKSRLSRAARPGVDTGVSDLVARLRAGEVAAFDEAYAQYHARLFGFLARLTGRRDLAHDLLQETWLRLATHAADLREDTQLGAWLFTVARNLCLSFQRWRVLDSERLGILRRVVPASPTSPFELAAASELERRLEAALASLPVRYREVLLLVAMEGLTPQQAATVLRIAPEAVRQRLLRARGMIEAHLAETPDRRRTEAER